MSEFSDSPFVAGSLTGLRAFAVDSLGRLKGPSYGGIFRPGENVAECKKREEGPFATGGMLSLFSPSMIYAFTDPTIGITYSTTPPPPPTPPRALGRAGQIQADFEEVTEQIGAKTKALSEEAVERKPISPHKMAGLGCTCGFYAYFDGRNDYKDKERITALVEGYGVCTVGSAGFRAEKARLVALVLPGKRVPLVLIERNYPDVPIYYTKRAALEAHPLTADPLPAPDDEDFWTREVTR